MPEVEESTTTQDTKQPEQNFQPGELAPFDYSVHEFVNLTPKAKNELKAMCDRASKRDTAARRMEVEQAWEARLFKRGYQYLFPRRGGGWQLTSSVLGGGSKSWAQMQGANVYETNIYGSHCDILTSALVRDIPECRFEPADPNYDPDITAADKAKDFKEIFSRNNDLRGVHTQAADYMCTDGRVLFYTRMVLDGQRFGYEEPEDDNPLAPEDETTGAPDSPNIEEGQEQSQGANDSPVGGRKPRGREVVNVFGKLEHKCPINTQDIHEMNEVQAFEDVAVERAKGCFPWVAEQIKPGRGAGEVELDRIARINVALALEGGYVTGDTFNQEVTISHNWFRPAAFMGIKDKLVRQEFFQQFPDGLLAVYAGDTLAYVRNECMDDHLHILQAFPGSGQNRIALMSKVLSVQKRLNNWIDLLNDYFVRCVSRRWYDSEAFDIEAVNNQANTPGQSGPFQSRPGTPASELVFVEPTPTHQPSLPEFINFFFNEFPEMLSGALPSLFGAESNTDTASGISMQRDQALGRLASPWGALQKASACYFRQAVQQSAKCRLKLGQTSISESLNGKTITMELEDLKGNVLTFPDADSNFPETWVQKSSRFQQLMTEGATNPLIAKLLSVPKNMKIAKDAVGLQDLEVPEADSVDKQLGEFEILLKTAPAPNPQVTDAQQQLTQHAQQASQEGPEAMAQYEKLLPQAMQAMQALPPEVSTVPVMQDASEDHQTEAETCKEWLIGAEGRKFKNGTPEQKAAWANVHLHWQEHMEMAQKLAPPPPTKPPSESISLAVDKAPPEVAAQALVKYYGLSASPQQFMQQKVNETEQNITEKKADYGK